MLKLTAVIEVGDQTKTLTFETEEQVFTIGRESKNDFQIPLTTVSRQHARVTMSDNQYFIEDLNSSHGSTLNGQRLAPGEKKLLRSGDTITLTKAVITVSVEKNQLERAPGEKTEALAVRAVEDILGKLGQGRSKDDAPFLRIMSGPDEGTKFYLNGPVVECVLGRSRENDLVINDPNASRRHALVKKDYNGVFFQCLGAKNLSQLNGKEVPRNATKRLRDRDEIAIGSVRILFIDPDAELLQSLSDIPGFEDPVEEEAPPEPAPDAAAPEGTEPSDAPNEVSEAGDAPPPEPAEPAPETEPPPAAENFSEKQVELPAPGQEPATPAAEGPRLSNMEMMLIGIVAFVVILGVVVLILLIS